MSTNKLGIALRRRFKSPRDCLRALGLDEKLLDVKRLAFDSRNIGAIPGTSSKMELEEMLCTVLSGHELQRARDLLHSIDADDGDGEVEQPEAEDDEVDEQELREQRRRAMAKTADFLADRKGMSADQIETELRDFPRNALHGGFGGRFSEGEDEDLKKVMADHRRRRLAGDAKRRIAFDARFPMAGRVTTGSVESDYGTPLPARRIATDGAAAKSFYERFPEAQRIG
jgi:hypothetical protein